MERIACIDIGSNSVLFTCAYVHSNDFKIVEDTSQITGLSKDMHGSLDYNAMMKTVSAVCSFKKKAVKLGCKKVYAIGTMALRMADNRNEFLSMLKKNCNIEVDVISGEMEGYYSFISVASQYDGKLLVLDIGGASTEVATGNRREVYLIKSLEMGAVTLTERFIKHDPPITEEIENMERYIMEKVSKLERPNIERVYGIGGTVTTIASIYTGERYNKEKIEGMFLKREEIKNVYNRLINLPCKEREKLSGMEKGRECVILAGTGILLNILDWLNIDVVFVSTGGVRIGFLMEKIKEVKNDTNI